MARIGTKHLFANFSIAHAQLIDPSYLRMTGRIGVILWVTHQNIAGKSPLRVVDMLRDDRPSHVEHQLPTI